MGGDTRFSKFIQHTFGFPLYRRPDDIVTSYFVSPKLLLAYRILICLWVLAVLLVQWIHDNGDGMFYFTYMSYMVLFFYFSLTVTLSFIRKSWKLARPWEHEAVEPSSIHVDRFSKFIILVGEIISVNEAVVVIVYWTLLAGGERNVLENYLNTNVHALSWPLIWFDYAMNCTPFHYSHVLYTLVTLVGYMFFSWVYQAAYHIWIYYFLDYTSSLAAALYIGLLLAFVIFYYIVFGLVVLRNQIYHKIHPEEKMISLTSFTEAEDQIL